MHAHLFKRNHNHVFSYLILFLLMTITFFSFTKCFNEPYRQLQIGIVAGITYAIWGIFVHYYDRDLNWKIVIEYTTVALVGIAMLWMLLSYIY